jgi:pimeloyl-ACP methyl ester carboxylesterase
MGGYVEIGVLKTWYDEEGRDEPLVLLHGGMSTNATWAAQMPELSAHFRVIAPERRGHGHTPDLEGPLSMTSCRRTRSGLWMRSSVARHIWWDGATAASSGYLWRWPVPTWRTSSS